jgi:hypothetical protein
MLCYASHDSTARKTGQKRVHGSLSYFYESAVSSLKIHRSQKNSLCILIHGKRLLQDPPAPSARKAVHLLSGSPRPQLQEEDNVNVTLAATPPTPRLSCNAESAGFKG